MEWVRMRRGLQLQPSLADAPSPSCVGTTRGQERSLQPSREDEERCRVQSLQGRRRCPSRAVGDV